MIPVLGPVIPPRACKRHADFLHQLLEAPCLGCKPRPLSLDIAKGCFALFVFS